MWWHSFVLDFLIKLIPSFESCCILEAGMISGIDKKDGLIHGDSDQIAVEGHVGTWYAIDETVVGGE